MPPEAAADGAPVTVLVAAGSNVEPERHLRLAVGQLAERYPGLRCSQAWRNRAVGFEGEDFVNLALAFDTREPVDVVVEALQAAEAACGRARQAPKWAPRSMDLDILLYGDRVCDQPGLVLPRPDLLRRPYMLGPAAELEPRRRHPTDGRTLAELWAAFDAAAHPMQAVDLGLRCSARHPPR